MSAPNPLPRKLRFDIFEVDLGAGELRRQGRRLKLQEQPFRILAVLLEKPGELATREELRQRLWPADTFVDFDHSLNIAINKLRETLGDSAERPRFIETLPRRGYRFLLPVEAVLAAAAKPAGTGQPRLWARPGVALGLAALAVAAIVLAWQFALRRGHARNPAPAPIRSLAVLPLENLSRDPEQEYFADGMTDELITDLGKIGGLRVISRTSVMHFKGTKKPLPEIARELNVDAVVEGTVVRAGDRVRVRAQLIRVATDQHLWAESYDRDLRDILALQREVAADIARQVQVRLTPQVQTRLSSSSPVDPEAYEAYVQGLYYLKRRSDWALKKAVNYFEQALARDPNYAPAYAGLADSYNLLVGSGILQPAQAYPKAKEACLKALQIDDMLAEGHTSLGFVKERFEWDRPGAEKEYRRALELNPNDATAHQHYAEVLAAEGRHREALAEARLAQEIDPVSPALHMALGAVLYLARSYPHAIEHYRKASELDPQLYDPHVHMSNAYALEGLFEQAVAEGQQALKLSEGGPHALQALGYAYAVMGRRAEARRIVKKLVQQSAQRIVSPVEIAILYAALGDKDAAFTWLDKAHQERFYFLNFLNVDARFDSLRSDPRFADLLRRVGLAP